MYFRCTRLVAALVAAVSFTACDGTSPVAPSTVPTASTGGALTIETNAVWKLQSLARSGSSAVTITDPSLFTMSLADNGALQLRADCNRANGTYTLSGNTLSVGSTMASTRAYCGSASLDTDYLAVLSGENIVSISGQTLQLSSSRGTLTFGR
jgi:heat shock protein HslJ